MFTKLQNFLGSSVNRKVSFWLIAGFYLVVYTSGWEARLDFQTLSESAFLSVIICEGVILLLHLLSHLNYYSLPPSGLWVSMLEWIISLGKKKNAYHASNSWELRRISAFFHITPRGVFQLHILL